MLAALTAAALMVQTAVGLPPPASAAPAEPPAPTDEHTPAEKTALTEAQRTGQPVPVEESLTETTAVLANPDGTFTLRSSARPVRTNKNGRWQDVDTSLAPNADGSLTPAAAPVDMSFSGGGTQPLVTMRDGNKQFSLSWPTPLPTPVIDGSSAVYPELLPGVDLRLTASSTGYSEVLVVKSQQAAANPALTSFKLHASTTGLDLTQTHDVISAHDDTGRVVFQGSTPIMWDSTESPQRGPAPTPTDPGGAKVSALDVDLAAADTGLSTAAELTVTPDQDALRGEDVVYPVYIDPVLSRNHDGWAEVTDTGWYYWNANMNAQVGRCGNWNNCNGSWVARSFFRFSLNDIRERNGRKPMVFDATLYATQTHGTSCTEQKVSLYQTDPFDESTRWPGPNGGEVDTKASAAGDQCGGAGAIGFNALSPVTGFIENSWWSYLHVGLRSPDENNRDQWKKFANNPYVDVTFAFPPNDPTGLAVGNAITCTGRIITPDAHPTLYATATDNNDSPLNIGLYYEVWNDAADKKVAANNGNVVIASGTQGQWVTDTNLGNGDYRLRVTAENRFPGDSKKNLWSKGWSSWLPFTTRGNPITATPTINSKDYPADNWGRPQNLPGTFTFDAKGAPHIVGFTYTFDGAGTERVPNTDDCNYNQTFGTTGGWIANNGGKATITVPAGLSPGYHTLHVRSFDDAHKLSPESTAYRFHIAPTYTAPAPTQRIEAETLTGTGLPTSVTNDAAASGGKYVKLTSTASGTVAKFPFTVSTAGDYNVDVGLVDNAALPDQVAFTLDGFAVSDVHQGGTKPTTTVLDKQIAGLHLTAGQHELGVSIAKKPDSTATQFTGGIDYLDLSPTVKLDAETLAVHSNDRPVTYWPGNPALDWNSSGMRRFEADNTGQALTLTFTTPIEADYALGLGLVANNNRGRYTVKVDDIVIGNTDTRPIDGYHTSVATRHTNIGGAHLTAGEHRITFRSVEPNPDSVAPRHILGLDYLTVQPINNVTAASFTDAMNNKGIGSDGTTAGNLDFQGGSLSTQTLAAAGLVPGTTVMVNGAAFALPHPNPANGNDNVVATGQTIPFPAHQQIKASAVGLLAISTCGTSSPRLATITYTDGTTSNPLVPEFRDWVWTPKDTTGIVLPYRNVGLGQERHLQPVITPVFLPAEPSKTIKSITLPNYGTALLRGTCDPSAALHVLAMAPRPVDTGWVGAWAAPSDAAVVPPGGHGFADKTLRTVLKPSVTGGQVRVKLSNALNTSPVTIDAATLAGQAGTDSAIAAPTPLTFSGKTSVTLPAGGEVYTDPVAVPSGGNGNLVVSLHLPTATTLAPTHGNATAPTFLAGGNTVTNTDGTPFTTTLTGSYFVTGVEMSTPDAGQGTVVVLGDSLTATAPPGSAQRNTWVDELPAKLAATGGSIPGGLVNASRAGVPDTARWRMTDGTGTTARDLAGSNHATIHGGVTWSTDNGGSLILNGTNGHLTASKAIDTSKNFSVTAWTKIHSLDSWQTLLSQDGNTYNPFYLQYSPAHRRWSLSVIPFDALPDRGSRLVSRTEPTLNTWTQLAATHDAATGTTRLYVNGELQDSLHGVNLFTANGPFTIGRAKYAGNPTDYYNGAVADVRVHQRLLSPGDIHLTYRQKTLNPPINTGTLTTANATTDLHHTALGAPNLRTVLIAVGATDILSGATATEVRDNIKNVISTNSAKGLKRHKRPDGDWVHIIVTTVPPLGLDANDPREAERRNLNHLLLNNYSDVQADYVVDYDAAVRDTTNPNQLASQYLTNNQPNTAYHNQIAQYLADAINDFPPRAEL
ncbi:LamG-like jellyroll fold domain-containing protein [Saccharothrix australiensis]|uniref:Concanavalin A-like lectin/glucanase superfamily protein n=1 Tax=Saccharothrix australiensis TaxID=2072 RepID=A0A495W0E0_9PSEU|nr:LamG-like jellyroll fold domain-containing protein [Saccharothrix australiensis]RKT54155.1 concanavalin A-like lectin/glucanase superfamily protein [Saccharothrix australiensis]